jgi:hypothetical protein
MGDWIQPVPVQDVPIPVLVARSLPGTSRSSLLCIPAVGCVLEPSRNHEIYSDEKRHPKLSFFLVNYI